MSAFDRVLLAALTVFAAATGALLLTEPQTFYTSIPGVATSGPFNAHFLRDVGLAYATLSAGAAFALCHPSSARTVTAMAATYLLGHAVLHVAMDVSSANTGPRSQRRLASIFRRLSPSYWQCVRPDRRTLMKRSAQRLREVQLTEEVENVTR